MLIGASALSKPRPSNNNDNKELVLAQKESSSEDYAQKLEKDLKIYCQKLKGWEMLRSS